MISATILLVSLLMIARNFLTKPDNPINPRIPLDVPRPEPEPLPMCETDGCRKEALPLRALGVEITSVDPGTPTHCDEHANYFCPNCGRTYVQKPFNLNCSVCFYRLDPLRSK